MKKLTLIAGVCLVGAVVFAQSFTDVDDSQYWGKTGIPDLTEAIDANNALLEDGTVSVTNGQAVTLAASAYVVTGTGGANDTTNTITLASVASTLVGSKVTLSVAAASSNLVGIADSGTANLTAAWAGDNHDTLTLYVADTNVFQEISRADN